MTEKVLIPTIAGTGHKNGVYHDIEDGEVKCGRGCNYYPISKDKAIERGFDYCKICSGNCDNSGKRGAPISHILEEMDPDEAPI